MLIFLVGALFTQDYFEELQSPLFDILIELCSNKAAVWKYVALDGQIGRGMREVPLHLKYAYLSYRGPPLYSPLHSPLHCACVRFLHFKCLASYFTEEL